MVSSTFAATIVAELICTVAAFTWLTISYAPKRNKLVENFARSIFSAMAALKIVSKCSFTVCKLRFFDDFCLAITKNLHRAKLSSKLLFILFRLESKCF